VKDPVPAEAGASSAVVELHGITKRFPGVVANKDIEITVKRGTVHAIVGENGAGKSTLMKILYGVQQPDEGTIAINGTELVLKSPTDAIRAGIGMVFQHFMLADNLTVLENVVLGAERLHGIGDRARAQISSISKAYGLGVDPDDLVADLGVGRRQRVEILKVLYRGARILILDEPTAVLVPQEVTELFDNLRDLKAEGLTVIFISHKLDEVLSVADEITVIRRGTTVSTVEPASINAHQLAELMVGSELPSPTTEESTVTDRAVLTVERVTLDGAPGNRRILDDVSLTIHAGEVVGIAGVEGNGQAELVEVIIGMRESTSGVITLEGVDISDWQVREIREAGVGFIPEDRHRHGMLLESPLWENVILGHQTQEPNVSGGGALINARAAKQDALQIVREYDVRTPSIFVTGESLSGGNQQKLIIGREMSHHPKVLLAAHPTRGVDVGAQAAIWDHIKRARRDGLAVLLISADLEELVGLSDTVRVILRGVLSEDFDPDTVTTQELGAAMTGAGGVTTPGSRAAAPPPAPAPRHTDGTTADDR